MVSKSPRLAKTPIINGSAPDTVIHALFENHQQPIQDCLASLGAMERNEDDAALNLLSQQLKAAELASARLNDTILSVDVGDCSRRVPALLINADPKPGAANHRPLSDDPGLLQAGIQAAIGLGVSMLLDDLSIDVPVGARILFCEGSSRRFPQNGQTDRIDSNVGALYGLDLNSSLPPGTIGLKTGPIFSSKSSFDISLSCENSVTVDQCSPDDLIQAAARLSVALHQAGSRRIDPLTPVSVTVSSINSGEDPSTGRPYVRLSGMYRSVDDTLNGQIKSVIQSTIEGVVSHGGVEYRLESKENSSVIYDDQNLKEKLAGIARGLLGANAVRRLQYQGGEDDCLAEFYESIPGMILQLGVPDIAALSSQNPEECWLQLRPAIETAVKILSLALSQDAGSA
jgi:metal-dependent amidase/aminoacylase/carboxypeptidase family protein